MSNTLTDLMRTHIIPLALPVLREACTIPALVHTDFKAEAAKRNQTLQIQKPQVMGDADDMATDIGTGGTTSTDLNDPHVDIVMDKWKYKQWEATDVEMWDAALGGALPSAAEAAIKSIANRVASDLFALYKDIPYNYGTAGVTPSAATDIIEARKILQTNLAPSGDRRAIVDVDAEAKFLDAFKEVNKTGSTEALIFASMGHKFGLDLFADQLIPEHTAGTFAAGSPLVNGTVAEDATTMNVDGGAAAETILEGDIFTVAGATGQYVCTANKAASGGAITGLAFYPAAPSGGFANSAAITIKATHRVNIVFQKNAFAFVARPLMDTESAVSESSTIEVAIDPISGIPLRLETWRAPGSATRYWRFDILYGVKTLNPELAARLLG